MRGKRTMDKETLKQKIMEFIILYIQIYGYAPSYKEISIEINGSTSIIGSLLDDLERDGKVAIGREGNRKMPRAIKVEGYTYVKEEK